MTHRLATNYAKNYCNRTPVVKVIVENVVTCFLGGHSVHVSLYCVAVFCVVCFSGFLADRTNGRAIGTVLRPSSVVCRRL